MLILEITANEFCTRFSSIFSLLGLFVTVIKIIVPILLIIFGMLDMAKAVTSGKDDEIKKSAASFGRRAAAAIIVFFVPTIVGLVLTVINDATNESFDDSYCLCVKNITGFDTACGAYNND